MDNFFYRDDLDFDSYLFHRGENYKSYNFLGSHKINDCNYSFVVWAPNAMEVYLVGDFNNWNETSLPLQRYKDKDVWEISVNNVYEFEMYKYRIVTSDGSVIYKSDPFAFHGELRPDTASKVYDLSGYSWNDQNWIDTQKQAFNKPVNIYEVNLLSWKNKPDGSPFTYSELADELVGYVTSLNYTHVEIMPLMEHPFDGSWGYQLTGYFAATSRFGTPKELMYLIDKFHQANIGVIFDWVPVHFCNDAHGLSKFDGGSVFESSDENKASNKQWGTTYFDFSKSEVKSFLISNIIFWHEYFHIDGIRADAVAFMIHNDYTGENQSYNYQAIKLLQDLNTVLFENFPNTLMIAEESTDFPKVTSPVDDDGLGFNFKWNMGWMNDILEYIELDPILRKNSQNALTFSSTYFTAENYILAFSHDEVVHGKKSMLSKMPGTQDNKFIQLKLLYMYMIAHPGKKLSFMGAEFAQFIEWDEWKELDWLLLDYRKHQIQLDFTRDLNFFYKTNSPLYEIDNSYSGFNWIECDNKNESIIAFERIDTCGQAIICIFNFTPVPRYKYPIGVDCKCKYKIVFSNTDYIQDEEKATGSISTPAVFAIDRPDNTYRFHNRNYEIDVDIPAYGALYVKKER